MGGVYVAHLKASTLARQPARAQRGQTALMGDLGKRIGLVHELRQLRRAEKLAHRSRNRLGVNQVLRHDRVDINRAHALLNRAFHTQQTNAILVFHQFADRAHAPVAEIVDIVNIALAIAQIDQRFDNAYDIFFPQDPNIIGTFLVQTNVHFHAADSRQIIAFAIKEQAVKKRLGRFRRRRLTGPHHAINLFQRGQLVRRFIGDQRVANKRAAINHINRQRINFGVAQLAQLGEQLLSNFITSLGKNLAGFGADKLIRQKPPIKLFVADAQGFQAIFGQLIGLAWRDFLARLDHNLAGLVVDKVVNRF